MILIGTGGCSDPRAHLRPQVTRASITFRIPVTAEENKAFREKLTAYLAGRPFSSESITLQPEQGGIGFYELRSVRNCRNRSGVQRALIDAAAPAGRTDEYRALAFATTKCIDEALVQRACAVTSLLGGKLPISNEHTARVIFLKVEEGLKPDANKAQFPDIEVVDYGDHWSVFRGRAPRRFLFWREGVTYGGGQLGMYIDKCDGSLSDVRLSE
jgi:hypothetical protein